MKKISLILTCFLFLLSDHITSQITYKKLFQTNNSSKDLYGEMLRAFPNKGCIVAGRDFTNGVLLRLDSLGLEMWNKRIGAGVRVNDLVLNRDTTFAFVATQTTSTLSEALIIKMNFHGGPIWTRKLVLSNYQDLKPLSIAACADSGLIVCGTAVLAPIGLRNSFVTKFDKNGTVTWSKQLVVSNTNTEYTAIKECKDSGFVLIGTMNQITPSITKLNKVGNFLWEKEYTALNDQKGIDILVRDNFLYAYLFDSTPILMKLDAVGNVLDAKKYTITIYNSPDYSSAFKLRSTLDKGFLIPGNTGWNTSGFIKTDSLGNPTWFNTGLMQKCDAMPLSDKGFIVMGNGPIPGFKGLDANARHFVVIKLDSLGSVMCLDSRLPSPLPYSQIAESVSSQSLSLANNGSAQPFTLSLSADTLFSGTGCVSVIGGLSLNDFSVAVSVQPNPSSGKFNISFKQVLNKTFSCSVYDSNGRLIKEEQVPNPLTDYELDCSVFSNGIYLLRIITEGQELFHQKIIISHE